MAQYAVLIYANDSAHALDATAADIDECDEHADELAASNVDGHGVRADPPGPGHVDPGRRDHRRAVHRGARRSWPASTSSRPPTSTRRWPSPAPTRSSARAAAWRSGRCTAAAWWSARPRDGPGCGRGSPRRRAPPRVGLRGRRDGARRCGTWTSPRSASRRRTRRRCRAGPRTASRPTRPPGSPPRRSVAASTPSAATRRSGASCRC